MGFYVYKGNEELGNEKLGTSGRMLWRDLKTTRGAIRRARSIFKGKPFMIYTFSNFYNDNTFSLVYSER